MQWFISNGGVCDKVQWPCVVGSSTGTDVHSDVGCEEESGGGCIRGVRATQDVEVDLSISHLL